MFSNYVGGKIRDADPDPGVDPDPNLEKKNGSVSDSKKNGIRPFRKKTYPDPTVKKNWFRNRKVKNDSGSDRNTRIRLDPDPKLWVEIPSNGTEWK